MEIFFVSDWLRNRNAIGITSTFGRYGGTYANEADVLNMALFGLTAKEWRNKIPEKKENINKR